MPPPHLPVAGTSHIRGVTAVQPRFSRKADELKFKSFSIVDDRQTGTLPVYLARIHYRTHEGPILHWSLVWPAYRSPQGGRGPFEASGWHMIDYQLYSNQPESPLAFRHQYKEPNNITTMHWKLHKLADLTADERIVLLGFSEGWIQDDKRANCISCVCDVIKELVEHKVLPRGAVDVLYAARNEDMKDPAKRRVHYDAVLRA